jgi:hypothetical protein
MREMPHLIRLYLYDVNDGVENKGWIAVGAYRNPKWMMTISLKLDFLNYSIFSLNLVKDLSGF